MSSDWSTVNAQSTSATATSATTSHHSTPTKPRLVSHRFTHLSVDEDFKNELEAYRCSGISFEEFLKCAFDVSPPDMEALKESIRNEGVHNTNGYTAARDTYASYAEQKEPKMYLPFAEMSNLVLERHQGERRIKALAFDGDTYVSSRFADRKPDLALVPEKDGDTELTMTSVGWHHMLCVVEFKKLKAKAKDSPKESSTNAKRTRDDQDVGDVEGGVKRSSTSTRTETSQSHTSTNAEGRLSGVSLQPVIKSGTSQGSSSASSWAHVSTVKGTTSASSSRQNSSRRGSRSRGSRGKLLSSKNQNSPISLHGVDAPETSSAHELMGPPDIGMRPETAQPEDQTLDSPSVIRRTSAITSNPSQATEMSSNATARSQPGLGDLGNLEVQLANYIAEVMSDRSDRTFAFGATIQATKMRLTYYSRSLYVISEEIDILAQPELFAVFLVLFSRQSLEKLGFNTDIKFCNPFDTKHEESKPLNVKLEAIKGGENLDLKPDTDLRLGRCLHTEYCLIGRATAVYDVERPEGCDIDLVMKLSWQVKSRRREDKAILIAREVDGEHSPEIYGVAVLSEKSPSARFKEKCGTSARKTSEDRELRILLMRKYKNVEDLDDVEFRTIIPQFVVYVHELFRERELLHRDISIFNMAYYEKEGRKIATLIDFDLATFPEDTRAQSEVTAEPTPEENPQGTTAVPNNVHPRPEDRSGTTPFMAIETLDLKTPGYKHHLCHELESIFYVVIWHGVGYRHKKGIYPTVTNRYNKDRKQLDILRDWRTGLWDKVKAQKKLFITDATDILAFITDIPLRVIALELRDLFNDRLQSTLQKSHDKMKIEARAIMSQDPAVAPVPMRKISGPLIAIFPAFAANWGISGVDCRKTCCVI